MYSLQTWILYEKFLVIIPKNDIAQLFHQTVYEINCRDYSRNQCMARSPEDICF